MSREAIIKKTITVLAKLPNDKINEIADFADYILNKYEDAILQKGIEKMADDSKAYDFLKNDEDIYKVSDLKEKYK